MKKNKMMRIASVLLVAVLLSTCAIFGTFAKYTTAVTSSDSARVAYWGFQPAEMNITGLFDKAYDKNVGGAVDVIAPGTTNKATFVFAYNEDNANAPEVAYTFTVSVDGSACDPTIANNPNIQWKLDNGEWTDWGTFLGQIKALSGDASGTKEYTANTLPAAFATTDTVHTVEWQWKFSTDATADAYDTQLGNAATLANVTLKITITATQID